MAVMGGDLYQVLAAWYKHTRKHDPDYPWVCYRNGTPLRSITTCWRAASVAAGLGRYENPKGRFVGNRRYHGALIHDFRRTAVSNKEDVASPESGDGDQWA